MMGKDKNIGLASELARRLGIEDSETTLLIEHYLNTAWERGNKAKEVTNDGEA